MKLAAATIALTFALAGTASADTPKTAKKVTKQLAHDVTFARASDEVWNTTKWPHGVKPPLVDSCRVQSRWRGTCDYEIRGTVLNPETGFYTLVKHCTGTVTVRVNKRTHRVSSRKVEAACITARE